MKKKRRSLRRRETRAESILWSYLRNRQLLGYKFRRQYSVDTFVLDFYCPELRLAIELDGRSHDWRIAREYDSDRQKYIEQFDVQFLRFKDEEVFDDVKNVLRSVANAIKDLTASSE